MLGERCWANQRPEGQGKSLAAGGNGGQEEGEDWEEGNYGMIAKFVSCMRAARVRSQIRIDINIKQKLSSNHDFWQNAKHSISSFSQTV